MIAKETRTGILHLGEFHGCSDTVLTLSDCQTSSFGAVPIQHFQYLLGFHILLNFTTY